MQTVDVSEFEIPAEELEAAILALAAAQQDPNEERAYATVQPWFPGANVMRTDTGRFLDLAAKAGITLSHITLMNMGEGMPEEEWTATLEVCHVTEEHLVSVDLDVTSEDWAVTADETVTLLRDHGWKVAPGDKWERFDCGGGEVHIPVLPRAAG